MHLSQTAPPRANAPAPSRADNLLLRALSEQLVGALDAALWVDGLDAPAPADVRRAREGVREAESAFASTLARLGLAGVVYRGKLILGGSGCWGARPFLHNGDYIPDGVYLATVAEVLDLDAPAASGPIGGGR